MQAFEKYKKDLIHGLHVISFNSRNVSLSQQKVCDILTTCHTGNIKSPDRDQLPHSQLQSKVLRSACNTTGLCTVAFYSLVKQK